MDNNPNNNKNDNKPNKGNKQNKQGWLLVLLTTLLTTFIVVGMLELTDSVTKKEISYSEFIQMVDDGKVEEVLFEPDKYTITLKEGEGEQGVLDNIKVTYYTGIIEDESLTERLNDLCRNLRRPIVWI